MTTDTMLRCALGVGERTLSDFRSDGLGQREMARLRAHVAECPACQARLDAFEVMAQALRAQPEPDDHARLWRNVRASIAAETLSASGSARHRRHAHTGERVHSTRFWAAFGSIAAVVALSVGFVALFVSRGGWPQFGVRGQATPIVIHSGSLTWRQVIVPKGFPSVDQYGEEQSSTYWGPNIAQSDGNIAYACQANKHKVSSPVVWATHDAGVSWGVITPPALPANTGGCRLTVDANDSNTLTVSFYPMLGSAQPALPDKWVTYASFDGGATWTKPAGLNDGSVAVTLASARGKTYAIRMTYAPDGLSQTVFFVSGDQMQRWSQIDANLPETQPNPSTNHETGVTFQIWVNSATGDVIDETYAGNLWSTPDDGAHWTKIAFPDGVYADKHHTPALTVGLIPSSGQLTICGDFTPVGADSQEWLACTTDDGKTWIRRPDLSTIGPGQTNLSVSGMGVDGSIYAVGLAPPANPADGNETLYRLPPDATSIADWQPLGEIPDSKHGSGYQVAPAGNHTAFWLFPGATTTSDNTGKKTFTQLYYYVATYP
ncbi:MAG TPA: zf-HC2 domain-containing protein [Ktedonobacterales bacterium]|jgi:hypothetical protein